MADFIFLKSSFFNNSIDMLFCEGVEISWSNGHYKGPFQEPLGDPESMIQKIVSVRINFFGHIYEEFKEIGETQLKIIDCFGR